MPISALAPIAWGATYYVTRQVLPAGVPLWGAAMRALPAGLVLLALARRLPYGSWWWRSLILGALNFGGFFVLVYLAAILLPTSVASSVMALAPLALAACAWPLLGQRPTARMLAAAVLGIGGVLLVVGAGRHAVSVAGIAVSAAALASSSLGAVLSTRWADGTPLLATTAWQLLAGGAMLLVPAVLVEGPPPPLDREQMAGFAFVSLVATALAFVCWFAGLHRLRAGTVGTVGLLNPVTGILLGTLAAGEHLTAVQTAGIVLVLAGIGLGGRSRHSVAPTEPADATAARPTVRI